MLAYNEIKPKTYVIVDGEPYEVLTCHIFRKQQRKPVNQTKLRNLLTGKIMERSFHQSESVEEAEISLKKIKYLYNHRGEYWFCEENNPSQRFTVSAERLGGAIRFAKENSLMDAVMFGIQIIGVRVPIKVELKVTEAPPAVRGDTAQGGTKQVTLETGATVSVPLFVGEGDIVRVNTETGQYAERVGKQ